MPDQEHNQDRSIEELLAAYTDQVIESQTPEAIPLSEDPEIKGLQETILQLRKEIPATTSQKSANAIKGNVLKAWQEQYQPKQTLTDKIKQILTLPPRKRYQSAVRRRQIAAVRIASAAILMIIVAFILLPSADLSDGSTSGAAAGEVSPWVLIGGLLLIGGVGLWWWLDSRRK